MVDLDNPTESVPCLMKKAIFGTWKLDTWNEEGAGMRYVRLLNNLEEMAPSVVFYEDTKYMKKLSTAAPVIYGGYVGVLQMWCSRFNIPFEGVVPGTIRKFLSGDGAKKKAEVPGLILTKYGVEVEEPDAADALAILSYVFESGLHKGISVFHAVVS